MTRLFPDKALFSGAAVARCSIPFVCVSCVIVLPAAETQQRRPLFLLSSVISGFSSCLLDNYFPGPDSSSFSFGSFPPPPRWSFSSVSGPGPEKPGGSLPLRDAVLQEVWSLLLCQAVIDAPLT